MAQAAAAPQSVVVVGGGIVGLSCAWALQQRGIDVEVLDRREIGAGASWGNAGYVSPALVVPLTAPGMLRYSARAVFDRRSPLSIPPHASLRLVRFLLHMARSCTTARWHESVATYQRLAGRVFDAFDEQQAALTVRASKAPVLACFTKASDATHLLQELQAVVECGRAVGVELVTGDRVRELEPAVSPHVRSGVRILGQRYLDPVAYIRGLADQVRAQGGKLVEHTAVTAVRKRGSQLLVSSSDGERTADAVVLATGAWLPTLAHAHGVRQPMYAGRGYSFTVPAAYPVNGPVYLPAARVAVSPADGERIKVAGIMELQRADARADRRRVETMVSSARACLRGVGWDAREHEWVGPRPLTADGLPLIGRSATPGVFVAAGHGMWGVTLGPLTGKLLAELIITGTTAAEIARLDPRR